ncbi:porin [Carnimonas bestiolae]|uniref:porin n=1 Tax=Carnimonas bestiolae TaxID=3402172 RepID=UPI003EDC86B2
MTAARTPSIRSRHLITSFAGVTLLALASDANAFTAFEDEANKLVISGRIAYAYDVNSGGSSSDEHGNAGSRINVAYERLVANEWTLAARWEEAFDPFFSTSEGDNHYNRYLYFGVSHPQYGALTAGRQNTILYDFVDVFTDQPWWYADYSEASYGGSDINGVIQRPSDTLKYVVNLGDWTLGAMYGWSRGDIKHDQRYTQVDGDWVENHSSHGLERKNFWEVGVQYRPGYDVTLAAAYHHARVDAGSDLGYDEPNANAWNLGVNWAPGNWFLGAVGGKSRNAIAANTSYNHYGAFAGYTFVGGLGEWGDLQPYYDYNLRTDQRSDAKLERHIVGLGAIMWHERLILAVDHMWYKDKGSDGMHIAERHPSTGIYARYNY